MANGRESWNSYIGFIFSAIGAIIGIEDIWRLPYIAGVKGGGALLIAYIIILFTLGLSLFMVELAVGRYFKTSLVNVLFNIRKRFKFAGIVIMSITIILLSYYVVILGWVFSYAIIIGLANPSDKVPFEFDRYINSFYPIASFMIMTGLCFVIIARGVSRGIERVNKIAMPILLFLVVLLTVFSISLPGASRGIHFYLVPDFHRLTDANVWIAAFGQAFFSLSLGLGVMITYGSYLTERKSVINSSLIIILSESIIVITVGIIVFSTAFSSNISPLIGPSLAFETLPLAFSQIQFGNIMGSLFFILFLIAGVSSALGYFQVPIAIFQDTFRFNRRKAAIVISSAVLLLGIPSVLSYSPLHLRLLDTRVLDLVDTALGTYGITISAALLTILVTWFMDNKKIVDEINRYGRMKIPYWSMSVIKIALPLSIMIIMLFIPLSRII